MLKISVNGTGGIGPRLVYTNCNLETLFIYKYDISVFIFLFLFKYIVNFLLDLKFRVKITITGEWRLKCYH